MGYMGEWEIKSKENLSAKIVVSLEYKNVHIE